MVASCSTMVPLSLPLLSRRSPRPHQPKMEASRQSISIPETSTSSIIPELATSALMRESGCACLSVRKSFRSLNLKTFWRRRNFSIATMALSPLVVCTSLRVSWRLSMSTRSPALAASSFSGLPTGSHYWITRWEVTSKRFRLSAATSSKSGRLLEWTWIMSNSFGPQKRSTADLKSTGPQSLIFLARTTFQE